MDEVPATETKAAFARRIGVKPPRVSQLVAAGLPVTGDGKVRVSEALAWLAARQSPIKRAEQGKPPLPSSCGSVPASFPALVPASDTDDDNPALVLLKARARRETTKADREALALAKDRGDLCDRAEIQRGLAAWGIAQRDAWIAWCSRAAPELAAELGSDLGRVFAALDRLVRAQLIDIADAPLPLNLKDIDRAA